MKIVNGALWTIVCLNVYWITNKLAYLNIAIHIKQEQVCTSVCKRQNKHEIKTGVELMLILSQDKTQTTECLSLRVENLSYLDKKLRWQVVGWGIR